MARSKEQRVRFAHDELLAKGNMDAVDEVFAADYVLHAGGKEHVGIAFVRRIIGQLRAAIPDLRVVEIQLLLQIGDTITWQRTSSGMHEADMSGIPPSGKRVERRDMLVSRFAGGRIVEEWAASERAGALLMKLPSA